MGGDYRQVMKWWTLTGRDGKGRLFSAVTADEARQRAREVCPEQYGTDSTPAERHTYGTATIGRRARRRNPA